MFGISAILRASRLGLLVLPTTSKRTNDELDPGVMEKSTMKPVMTTKISQAVSRRKYYLPAYSLAHSSSD
ncbi:hypothetical protein X801_06904 [Opisthorchis viverrini]|uniref:Uncharacterized protein n=1 Tax=Opisthorchis viverrini TaxID=6198 RepID=A0A1S8WSL9_OPIVI|nr:hypothetical protein X801_06904 [Opisthorchis viverrini]